MIYDKGTKHKLRKLQNNIPHECRQKILNETLANSIHQYIYKL